MKNLLLLLAAIAFLASCSPEPKSKAIYIVRHAEKQLVGDDPELAQSGALRAQKLAQILSDQDIKHIYSTNYQRTKQTAQPTADEFGLEIELYDPRNHDELVEKLKSVDGNALVVGHSNTVGQIANYFVGEGEKFQDLDDSQYNFIYIVSLDKNGSSVITKTYKDY